VINVQEIVLKLRWWRDSLLCGVGAGKNRKYMMLKLITLEGGLFENFHILLDLFMKNVTVHCSQ
jgi:hypothetical protein